jgi:hypothetical protein
LLILLPQLVSLQRYRKAYKLPDHPAASREDLLTTIIRHFSDVVSCHRENANFSPLFMASYWRCTTILQHVMWPKSTYKPAVHQGMRQCCSCTALLAAHSR